MAVPLVFTRGALRELDRRAVEEYHIPILVLMENAGRAVADAARRMLPKGAGVLILAGSGNNGGDGMVAARHLHNSGISVTVLLLAERNTYKDAAGTQLQVLDAMKLPVEVFTGTELRDYLVDASPDDLIIDALFGTGLSRAVTGLPADVINGANAARRAVLAVDVPSGLDADSGEAVTPGGPVIRATETVAFCGTRPGYARAKAFTGKVTVADIGAPRGLLLQLAVASSTHK